MKRLIPVICQIMAQSPGAVLQNAAQSTAIMLTAALLFMTCWIATIAGMALLLARGIGVVPALLCIGGLAFVAGFGVTLGQRPDRGLTHVNRSKAVRAHSCGDP